MEAFDVGLIAAFVVVFGLVSRLAVGRSISGPMAFVGFGMLIGPAGLDLVDLDIDAAILEVLAEVALTVVLFTDATRIDVRELRRSADIPARLLAFGMPLTVVVGLAAGLVLLGDLAFWEAALLAAILAPTDAALGQAVVSDEAIPVRVRQALNVESGLNDGIAAPLVTIFLALAAFEIETGSAGMWARFALQQIGYGLLIGAATGAIGGWLIDYCSTRNWMTDTFRQLSTLALALAAFGFAVWVGGNGFVAAFIAGLAFGVVARDQCPNIENLSEDEGQLLALLTFLFFGVAVAGPLLDEIGWQVLLYAVLSLTLVRGLPVAVSLAGTKLRPETRGLIGWFGPRGLASIAFVLMILEEADLPGSRTILLTVTCTVLLSVLAHGVTAVPAARAYGRRMATMSAASEEAMPEEMPTVEHPLRVTHRQRLLPVRRSD